MLRRLATVVAFAASVGWIAPMLCAVWFLIDWCRLEASPSVYGHQRGENSFPFLSAAAWMLNVAAVWAAIASAAWLVFGLWFVAFGETKPNQAMQQTRDSVLRNS